MRNYLRFILVYTVSSLVVATILLGFGCSSYVKIAGQAYLNVDNIACYLMDFDSCGNSCGGSLSFISNTDTILLVGPANGVSYSCQGNDCDLREGRLHCEPLKPGRKYELRGKYLDAAKRFSQQMFEVVDFKEIDKQ